MKDCMSTAITGTTCAVHVALKIEAVLQPWTKLTLLKGGGRTNLEQHEQRGHKRQRCRVVMVVILS